MHPKINYTKKTRSLYAKTTSVLYDETLTSNRVALLVPSNELIRKEFTFAVNRAPVLESHPPPTTLRGGHST